MIKRVVMEWLRGFGGDNSSYRNSFHFGFDDHNIEIIFGVGSIDVWVDKFCKSDDGRFLGYPDPFVLVCRAHYSDPDLFAKIREFIR